MSNFWGLFFHAFMGKNLILNFYIERAQLKSCLIQNWKKIEKNLGSILGGLKIVFFKASCYVFRVKGACPLLLPLVSLVDGQNFYIMS